MQIYAPVLDKKDKTGTTFNYAPVMLTEEMKNAKWFLEGNYLVEVSRDVAFEHFPNYTLYFNVGNGILEKRNWWSNVFCKVANTYKTHQFPENGDIKYFLVRNVIKAV